MSLPISIEYEIAGGNGKLVVDAVAKRDGQEIKRYEGLHPEVVSERLRCAEAIANQLGDLSYVAEIIRDIEAKVPEMKRSKRKRRSAGAALMDAPDDGRDLRWQSTLLSDIGNGARLALAAAADYRFCEKMGGWVHFNQKCWKPDDTGAIGRLAQKVALGIIDEAKRSDSDVRRSQLLEWASKSQKCERISAMMKLAKPHLPVTTDRFDADPWLLNCPNGTVDLRTGELRPHRREDYCTKICRVDYDPAATAPTLIKFLQRIFRAHLAVIPYVQKASGYAATGITREQVLFFLHGGGSNGKTTLLDILLYVLGDYAGKADRELLTAKDGASHPTNIADLKGRRLVVVSETNEGGRWDEGKLKDLVGETHLKARFMRQDFFDFVATHKIFAYSNHRPIVRGTDLGFWRRMRLIPFIETIAAEERDMDMPAKLEAEAKGVLAWIVAGCLLWQREGLGMPEQVRDATDGYRTEMDNIGAFLEECCVVGTKLVATARDLYRAYSKWCEERGEHSLSQKRLGMSLGERGFEVARNSVSGRKEWLGIGLQAAENGSDPTLLQGSFGNR